jgi:hypothetical protein
LASSFERCPPQRLTPRPQFFLSRSNSSFSTQKMAVQSGQTVPLREFRNSRKCRVRCSSKRICKFSACGLSLRFFQKVLLSQAIARNRSHWPNGGSGGLHRLFLNARTSLPAGQASQENLAQRPSSPLLHLNLLLPAGGPEPAIGGGAYRPTLIDRKIGDGHRRRPMVSAGRRAPRRRRLVRGRARVGPRLSGLNRARARIEAQAAAMLRVRSSQSERVARAPLQSGRNRRLGQLRFQPAHPCSSTADL